MSKISLLVVMGGLLLLTNCKQELLGARTDARINHFEFDYLQSRAKFKYTGGESRISANANFRIKQGEKIWVSISPGLGLEVARVLVDGEKIQMINKLKKEYFVYDYDFLTKKFGFEFTYDLIETAVIGNVLFEPTRREIVKDADYLQYARMNGTYEVRHYVAKKNAKLKRLMVDGPATSNTISVNYGGFAPVSEQEFPQKIRVKIQDRLKNANNIDIDIDYNRTTTQTEPLSFPFKVTDRYERKTP